MRPCITTLFKLSYLIDHGQFFKLDAVVTVFYRKDTEPVLICVCIALQKKGIAARVALSRYPI